MIRLCIFVVILVQVVIMLLGFLPVFLVIIAAALCEVANICFLGRKCVFLCKSQGPILATALQSHCTGLLARGISISVGPYGTYLRLVVPN